MNNKKLMLIPAFIFILIIAWLYLSLFAVYADVKVFVSPKTQQKTAAVTFTNVTDVENANIASEILTVSEEGSISTKATGKKDTGTKSKGKVTVFNNSDSTIVFQSGTSITSSNKLEFSFDNAVTVASASGDIFSGTTPGTASVGITADQIGQEYNLPSNTKFSIGSNSQVAAKNDDAFSGGTKKAVTIVSEDDHEKLLEGLPKQLESKASNNLKSKVGNEIIALPTFVNITVTEKNFDKKVGDETSSVSLKGTVDFEAVTYKNSDIIAFASSVFGISKEQLEDGKLDISAKNIGITDDDEVNADLNIKAGVLPKIDSLELSKQIKGISILKAQNMISNIDQVESVEIKLRPSLPFLPKNIPSDPKKIKISITTK